ncbi:MAG TPA: cytochrome C oxidase subunit IV family protein [Candidatus Binataceae bacterium]|nr:cytochrome C oxidase subunit IV family protein [Candidatus Binataceae bacterium]
MSEATQTIDSHPQTEAAHHPGVGIYLMVAVFLVVLTVMEITVFYVPALKTVIVPVLLILAAAKFALIAMFFMHLKYDSWTLSWIFVFPLTIAALLAASLLMLFAYLSHHLA